VCIPDKSSVSKKISNADMPSGNSADWCVVVDDETTTAGSHMSEPKAERIAGRWRPILAWTLVGSWGAWAVVRLTGADRLPGFGVPVTPLLSLTPYVAAAAPVPVICAAVLRRWRATAVSAVVAAGLLTAVLPRVFAADQPQAAGPTIRVLSGNLMFSRVAPEYVYALIKRTGADVVSLQEFNPDEAAGLTKAGLDRLLPYHNLDPRWEANGSGIYSRFPLKPLPSQPGTAMAMPNAELELPGGRRLQITAVHPLPPISGPAFGKWRHDLRGLPAADPHGPVRILAGDYNASLDHAMLRSVLGRGYVDVADQAGKGLNPTWGVSMYGPPLSLDHILVDRRCAVRQVSVHDLPGSDHRAVLAELRLP
jgi:endonuclease/exonuclease/phosphatase (EEP) superfamily protein YafD